MLSSASIRNWGWRHSATLRWAVAAVLTGTAAITWFLQDPPPATRLITVAATDISSGATIARSDVTTAADSLGLTTVPTDTAVGETVRGPIAAGEPITPSRLSPGRSVPLAPGKVIFPLTIPDARIAGLLQSGDHVDVMSIPQSGKSTQARVVADGLEVLAVPTPPPEAGGTARGIVILVSAEPGQALELAGISAVESVRVTIR